MKCGVCGQQCPDYASVCPSCGSSLGNGGFSGAADGFSGAADPFGGGAPNSFDGGQPANMGMDSFGAPAPAPQPSRKRSSPLPLILAAVALALAAAVYFVFFNHKTVTGGAQTLGFSAPSGYPEQIGRGRWLLTNELLVTGDPGCTQAEMEKLLADLDGAVVGYFPLINQYQVRFNTQDRAALDALKARLSGQAGIQRIDYNILLDLSPVEAMGQPDAVPAQAGAVGLIAGAAPETAANQRFFLPSHSFLTEEDWATFAQNSQQAQALMQQGADAAARLGAPDGVLLAGGLYFETDERGALSFRSTTGALRWQLASLVQAGAPVIDFALAAAPSLTDEWVNQEAELWDLTLTALERTAPAFLICKTEAAASEEEADYLARILRASERGRAHTLFMGLCGTDALDVQDATGAGLTVYDAPEAADRAEACAPSLEIAALYAVQAVKDGGDVKARLLSGTDGVAVNAKGTVLPVIGNRAASVDCAGLAVVTVSAVDSVTGRPIPGARIKASGGASAEWTAARGTGGILVNKGRIKLDASADGYGAARSQQVTVSGPQTAELTLNKNNATTGSVKGSITDASGNRVQRVTVTVKETGTNIVYPAREIPLDYSLTMYPGTYDMTLTAPNRTPVTIYGVAVTAGRELQNPPITLSEPSDLPGKAEGTIKDALTGAVLEGARLDFYPGADAAKAGSPVASVTSGGNGTYSVSLLCGAYTAYVSKDGYKTGKMVAFSVGEKTTGNQNCSITPNLPEGQVRIVLEWGASPSDLDSHLVNKTQNIHIFFPDDTKKAVVQGREVANLDVDDTSSYGPETTTILKQLPGKYTFYVHDYTNKDVRQNAKYMARSGATVTVYVGDQDPIVFRVPDREGTLWEVFSLENGVITPGGAFTYESDPRSVGR